MKYVLIITERKLITLYKILDYVNRRPQQMNVDLTYGITLTEGKKFLYKGN